MHSNTLNHLNRRVQVLFIIWTIVVILVLSSLFYRQSKNAVLEKAYDTNIALLKKEKNLLENNDKIAYHITEQVFSDFNVAYLLYGKTYDAIQLQTALTQLKSYRLSIPYIDSIYIYNKYTKSITISSDYNGQYNVPVGDSKNPFFDKGMENIILNSDDRYNIFQPIPRIINVRIRNEPISLYLRSYIRTVSYPGSKMDSAIIINFSENWFNISTKDLDNQIILVNDEGIVLTNKSIYQQGADISEEKYFKTILENPTIEGYFLENINDKPYVITYLMPDRNGLRYIGLMPYSNITQPLSEALNRTLLITIVVLIICLLISYAILRLFSKPINKIKVQINQLEKENRKAQISEKNEILRKLILGKLNNKSEEKLQVYSKMLDINLDFKNHYQVILIKIDDFLNFIDKYTLSNQNLMIYGIINILKELIEKKFLVEVIETGEENSLVLLIEIKENQSLKLTKKQWIEFLTPMTETVFDLLNISISFIVGLNSALIEDIPTAYRLTKEASFHRMFYPKGTLLFAEEDAAYSTTDYIYPKNKDKALISTITTGEAKEAKEILFEILEDARQYPYSIIIFAVANITHTFNNLFNEMERASFLSVTEETRQLILQASQLDEQTIDNFFGVIDLIVSSIEDKRNYKHIEILEQINKMIETHYTDKDFGLAWIADEIGMSSDYIGRIYRRYSLQSLSDKIVQVRISEAKRILVKHPNLAVYRVAERTGFSSNSYFSRIFRRVNGMTPNEYRKNISKERSR